MSWWSPSGFERLREADEVDRDQLRSLVDQLVEAVLAVRPRLAPEHRARLVVDRAAVEGHALPVRLHRQLLEVGGEALQVLAVRHDAEGLRAEEVRVPDAEEPHQHGEVALERRRAEVLVHRVEAGEQLAEAVGADREHRREADRRVHRVAAADPVPEAEHVLRVDAEPRDLVGVRRDGDEVLRDRRPRRRARASAHARAECAFVIVSSVVNVFDEMTKSVSSGVEVARRLDEVGRVDVRDEAERQVAARVVPERLVRHHRPEVGAADADVDDVADRLARVPLPLARADALGERGHAVEHLVHLARRRRRRPRRASARAACAGRRGGRSGSRSC